MVDREMRIVVGNRGCEQLRFAHRGDRRLAVDSLDIGLPISEIRSLIGSAFVDPTSAGEVVVDAVNRRGWPIRIRVTCRGFRSGDDVVNHSVDGVLCKPVSPARGRLRLFRGSLLIRLRRIRWGQ
jgi:two-component system CheB/CheR fusion protein